ncbi:MAG: xanthine dehydrogenase, partial [Chloroflexi bacterium]
MNITLKINGIEHAIEAPASTTLLAALRGLGFHGVKFGDEQGLSGADTILLDGRPVNAGSLLAAQAQGHAVATIEALGEHPEQGWRKTDGLHPLQKAFIESGAIQCGYCTPAQILAAKSLLEKNPNPGEGEVREAISGVLCRCTGYLKPVQAVMRAAAVLRGEDPSSVSAEQLPVEPLAPEDKLIADDGSPVATKVTPKIVLTPQTETYQTVGKPEKKVDAIKLAQGKPAFTADVDMRGMLYAKVLRSPHAHAKIKRIDATKALALQGVVSVLTWRDIPRVVYSTAGQSDPIPGPLDSFSLDHKVRFVGDRVAFVAAETPEIAEKALSLIEVEYEILPAILDSREAMKPDAIKIHDEPEYVNFADSNPEKNLAAHIRIDIGDVNKGFAEADEIFEAEYEVPKVQQAHIEPHVCVTYWDEDDRLVIRTSTQVPFHARRMLAPVLGLPVKRIRVVKPRIGGGFGGKQEVLMEDVAAHLTIATKRPVIYEYSREEEFIAARSRHPMRVKMKTGVKKDGTITANAMYALSDTGAYGCHALTVTGNTGHKSMALYVGDGEYRKSPNIQFYADVVYT